MSYKKHIKSAQDLVTTYNETRSGFISIALEKNKQAKPYIEEARVLKNRIIDIKKPSELTTIQDIKSALISASGISDKASKYLGEHGCNEAIEKFIENFLVPAGGSFKEELIFRFLLTKGDSLGGSMRNILGLLAKRKLNSIILAALSLSKIEYLLFDRKSEKWLSQDSSFDKDETKGIFWKNRSGEVRSLYYDVTVPLIKNNIDIILLNTDTSFEYKNAIQTPQNFIALGELKGGIDPAGADEHWKTAKTAIDRIVNGFKSEELNPKILYVGAAIENKMAGEIFSFLESEYISNAANLTKEEQMTEIADWLIKI